MGMMVGETTLEMERPERGVELMETILEEEVEGVEEMGMLSKRSL